MPVPVLREVAEAVKREATTGLDKAEALKPGSGQIDLWGAVNREALAGARPGATRTTAAAGIDYTHRLSKSWSAFGRGWAATTSDDAGRSWEAGAIGGLRMRF